VCEIVQDKENTEDKEREEELVIRKRKDF